jgi:hypothetical protein
MKLDHLRLLAKYAPDGLVIQYRKGEGWSVAKGDDYLETDRGERRLFRELNTLAATLAACGFATATLALPPRDAIETRADRQKPAVRTTRKRAGAALDLGGKLRRRS